MAIDKARFFLRRKTKWLLARQTHWCSWAIGLLWCKSKLQIDDIYCNIFPYWLAGQVTASKAVPTIG